MNKIKGLGVALVTPFNTDLSIDFLALENLINLQIESGVDYIVLLGTTAESVVLSKSEKLEIISFSKKIISSRITLVLGIGGNDTLSLVEEINNTNFTGIDAVLSVSPYYNKPSQDGIYEHYKMISKACPVPIIIYNVPSRTSIDISIMTTLRLANNFKNIVAIKEASGNIDKISRIINEKPSNFVVLSGDDALTFPLICLGAEGVISVVGQSFPSDYGAMVRSAINGGGLAMLSRFVVGRHIAAGTLVSILDEYVQEDVPIYAVYPSGKHLSPKVRAFLDFLIEIYGPVPYWDEAGDHKSEAAKRTVI